MQKQLGAVLLALGAVGAFLLLQGNNSDKKAALLNRRANDTQDPAKGSAGSGGGSSGGPIGDSPGTPLAVVTAPA